MNRLFEMVYLLMERESMTAAQLAEHFEVSSRTIYRDMDALSSAGIPIYATKGKGGGIRLLPDFVLNKSLLSEREQDEILFALQSLSATQAAECDGILSRMSGLFRKEPVDWIDVDFSHWGSGTEEKEKFQTIKTGILERRAVTFAYHSSYGEQSERTVNPVKLRFKSASWYLQGICQKKQAYRTFKICRMQKVQVTEERFSPPTESAPPLDISPWEGASLVSLELWFSSRIAFRVYDEFDPEQIEKQEDGSFLVCIQYPAGDWIPGYLLSFGEDVRVLSPPDIRRLLEEKSKKIAKFYQSDENMTHSCPISSAIVEPEQTEREEK